ncbi:type II toxin-antitoxin system RelE/ParE family toxin [Neorhizobium sp. JUb45]|uniref:type II toxin-antitoxin system RelE/ParE family toxin n=1 Tax=unclassified Neorhizobium TaxID=2629175 RepID=UPI00104B8D06|nr:type II toxin-antitoxin system RelE/ParE family toxin [Neorhizobium sp. JUb45]
MRTRVAVWTTKARADVVEDHDHIAFYNPVAATAFAREIFAKMRSAASLGLTGVDRSEYGEGLRSLAFRERIIFFHISETELTVVRVLHGHQDISSADFMNIRD